MKAYKQAYIKAYRTSFIQLGANVNPPNYSDLQYDYASRSSLVLVDKIAADNAEVVGVTVGIVATTATLTFADLLGITVVDYTGTAAPTINVNNVEFATGSYSYLELSDGTKIYFNGHTYDSLTGAEISQSGFTFALDTDASPLTALDNGYVDKGGLQIINPIKNITNVAVYDKMYLGGNKLNNLISSFVRFPTTLNEEIGSEILINSGTSGNTDWVDSNADGLADDFFVTNATPTIVTGNGFIGNAQRIVTISASTCYINLNGSNLITGKQYRVTGKYRSSNQLSFNNAIDVTEALPPNTADAISFSRYGIAVVNGDIRIYMASAGVGDWLEIDELSVQEVASIFDRSNTTIHSAASRSSLHYDSGDPTLYHASELEYDVLVTYFEAAYIDRMFTGIKADYTTQDFIFRILEYATQKTGDDLTRVKSYIKYA